MATRPQTFLLAGLVALLMFSSPVWAQSAPKTVQVTVHSVLGTNEGGEQMPSELGRDVQSSLSKMNYIHFEILDTQRNTLGPKAQATLQVTGGRTLTITIQEIESNKVRLHIRLVKGSKKIWDSTMGVGRDKSIVIGGQEHGTGMLFLPITITFPK